MEDEEWNFLNTSVMEVQKSYAQKVVGYYRVIVAKKKKTFMSCGLRLNYKASENLGRWEYHMLSIYILNM